jgi:hypothetical protein
VVFGERSIRFIAFPQVCDDKSSLELSAEQLGERMAKFRQPLRHVIQFNGPDPFHQNGEWNAQLQNSASILFRSNIEDRVHGSVMRIPPRAQGERIAPDEADISHERLNTIENKVQFIREDRKISTSPSTIQISGLSRPYKLILGQLARGVVQNDPRHRQQQQVLLPAAAGGERHHARQRRKPDRWDGEFPKARRTNLLAARAITAELTGCPGLRCHPPGGSGITLYERISMKLILLECSRLRCAIPDQPTPRTASGAERVSGAPETYG